MGAAFGSRRAELVAEIREHIEAALRQEDAASEVAIGNVLERLGPPEETIDAAEPPPVDEAPRSAAIAARLTRDTAQDVSRRFSSASRMRSRPYSNAAAKSWPTLATCPATTSAR